MEVKTSEAYDRVYAYLSLEGIPEQRIPSDDSVFIQSKGGRGNIAQFATGQNTYVLPLPKDESLTVEGECWGWSGGDLSQLSSFSESIPASQWAGGTGTLGNDNCLISYGLQANYSSGNTYETFAGKGGNIPPPFNVRVDRTKYADETGYDTEDPFYWSWWFESEVFWQWTGEYKDISGFTILLNGQKLKTVPAKERKTIVQLPSSCGLDNKWEVVANGKDGTSPVSQPYKEVKTAVKCGKYIKVIFDHVKWKKTCDESWICHWDYYQWQIQLSSHVFFHLIWSNITLMYFPTFHRGLYFFKWLLTGDVPSLPLATTSHLLSKPHEVDICTIVLRSLAGTVFIF